MFLAAYAEVAAAAVIALSFMPWVEVSWPDSSGGYTLDIRGDHTTALTSFGDGYLTAGLGAIAFAGAILLRFRENLRRLLSGVIAICVASITGIALSNAIYDWGEHPRTMDGATRLTTELWMVMTLCLLMGATGFGLLRQFVQAPAGAPTLDEGAT